MGGKSRRSSQSAKTQEVRGGFVVSFVGGSGFNTRQFDCQVVAGTWQGMAGVTRQCLRFWQSMVAGRQG